MRTVATEARLRSMLAHPVRQVAMHHIAKLCAQHTRTQQVMARATSSILSTSASHTEPELSTTMSESVVPLPCQACTAAAAACGLGGLHGGARPRGFVPCCAAHGSLI